MENNIICVTDGHFREGQNCHLRGLRRTSWGKISLQVSRILKMQNLIFPIFLLSTPVVLVVELGRGGAQRCLSALSEHSCWQDDQEWVCTIPVQQNALEKKCRTWRHTDKGVIYICILYYYIYYYIYLYKISNKRMKTHSI